MREEYTNREDQLYCRVTNVVNGQITEYFKPGKPTALQGTADSGPYTLGTRFEVSQL